jgi:hypothetical protein
MLISTADASVIDVLRKKNKTRSLQILPFLTAVLYCLKLSRKTPTRLTQVTQEITLANLGT